jgi:hypothetical protein
MTRGNGAAPEDGGRREPGRPLGSGLQDHRLKKKKGEDGLENHPRQRGKLGRHPERDRDGPHPEILPGGRPRNRHTG